MDMDRNPAHRCELIAKDGSGLCRHQMLALLIAPLDRPGAFRCVQNKCAIAGTDERLSAPVHFKRHSVCYQNKLRCVHGDLLIRNALGRRAHSKNRIVLAVSFGLFRSQIKLKAYDSVHEQRFISYPSIQRM
jgi:hypothetical protein